MVEELRARIEQVYDRIERAALRSGRSPEDITLVAVTKTIAPVLVQEAVDAGIRNLGENRVQEASAKAGSVNGSDLRWHLIGHLQANKARAAVGLFDFIH